MEVQGPETVRWVDGFRILTGCPASATPLGGASGWEMHQDSKCIRLKTIGDFYYLKYVRSLLSHSLFLHFLSLFPLLLSFSSLSSSLSFSYSLLSLLLSLLLSSLSSTHSPLHVRLAREERSAHAWADRSPSLNGSRWSYSVTSAVDTALQELSPRPPSSRSFTVATEFAKKRDAQFAMWWLFIEFSSRSSPVF